MKFTAAAILSALISAVVAQAPANAGVAVNLPSLGQVLQAGTSFTVTWTVNATGASANINSIALMNGGSAALSTSIANILSGPIPANPPQYVWNIPATVETNPSYVLALAGDNGGTTYSTYFTIMGAAPGTTNITAAASSAPAASANSTATATAGASGSGSNSTATATPTGTKSGANNLKAGLVGAAGVAGAVALLL